MSRLQTCFKSSYLFQLIETKGHKRRKVKNKYKIWTQLHLKMKHFQIKSFHFAPVSIIIAPIPK